LTAASTTLTTTHPSRSTGRATTELKITEGRFSANAAWLVLAAIAFNLTRAAATLTGPRLAKARTATIRRTLITVPARIASSARRLTLHLPRDWPWEAAWNTLFNNLFRRHQPILA
jgi:hypothetical protein